MENSQWIWEHLQRAGFSVDFQTSRRAREWQFPVDGALADWEPSAAARGGSFEYQHASAGVHRQPSPGELHPSQDHNFFPAGRQDPKQRASFSFNNSLGEKREHVNVPGLCLVPQPLTGQKKVTIRAGRTGIGIPLHFEVTGHAGRPGSLELTACCPVRQRRVNPGRCSGLTIHALPRPPPRRQLRRRQLPSSIRKAETSELLTGLGIRSERDGCIRGSLSGKIDVPDSRQTAH